MIQAHILRYTRRRRYGITGRFASSWGRVDHSFTSCLLRANRQKGIFILLIFYSLSVYNRRTNTIFTAFLWGYLNILPMAEFKLGNI